MKSKDKPRREPRKEPQGQVIEPTSDERKRARLSVVLRESDRAYAAYFATRDPREQINMPRP
jgi:hypothetical protein